MYEVNVAFEKSTPESRDSLMKLRALGGQFKQSGLLPDETRYVDAMKGFDGREGLREALTSATGINFQKANSITGMLAGANYDSTLIPIYVDPTIVDLTKRLTPLVELIPRVTNYGKSADFNQLTGRGVVGARLEDAALPEADDTYARKHVAIKYFYEVGRVTGPMLAASRQYLSNQYIDALNLEVRNKTASLRYAEEDTIINGDVATTRTAYGGSASGGDALNFAAEYSGLAKTIDGTGAAFSVAPISGVGGEIAIPDLRAVIKVARTANESTTLGQGDPNLMITDFGTLDKIKGLIQQYQRYVNTNFEIAWGIKTLEFEGLPVIASKFEPVGSTTNVRKLQCLSLDSWQMRVLQDVTYEELSKNNDSYKFMIKVYEALIATAPEFNAQIETIHD